MTANMKRREFITLLGGVVAAWPLAARAQQMGKLPTIGYLGSGTPATQSAWVAAFVQRLPELGWIEGRTVAVEYRWAEGRDDLSGEEDNIGRNYFARSPGSDVWVSFHDLRAAVCDRLWTRMKAGDFDGHRDEVPF